MTIISCPGAAAPLRYALAPGYYIPHLRRYWTMKRDKDLFADAPWAIKLRAFGAHYQNARVVNGELLRRRADCTDKLWTSPTG